MKFFVVWRLNMFFDGWVRTPYTVNAQTDKAAQSKWSIPRRCFMHKLVIILHDATQLESK